MVAYARLDEFPVVIAFSVPLDGILAPWKRQTLNLTVFALLVTVAISLITLRLIRAVHVAEMASVDLEHVNNELQILSVTDKLTQVYNRVRLDEVLRAEMSRASRYGTPLSIALVDLDFFKQVNDVYGHTVGDEVLIRTAEILRSNIRSEDTVGRWGGEEFLIVFPQTEPDQAVLVAEKIRAAIESDSIGKAGRRSASFGVTGFIPGDSEITILARADHALYEAKSKGRNLVVVDMARPATPGWTT
jgi:diguanylate cyclase (GGDEF)-like protein